MGLADAIQMYLHYMGEVQQASKHTISAYHRDLHFFLKAQGLSVKLEEVQRSHIQD